MAVVYAIAQHTDIIDATLILRQLKEEEEGLLPSSSPYEIYISESSEMHGTEAETQAEAVRIS